MSQGIQSLFEEALRAAVGIVGKLPTSCCSGDVLPSLKEV